MIRRLTLAAARLSNSRLATDTLRVGGWQTARIAAQAAWVILLARLLGPADYGAFAGIAGLATVVGGLTGAGQGLVLLQDASREPALFGTRWRQAWQTCLLTGSALALVFVPLTWLVVSSAASIALVVAIALAEVVLFPMVSLAAFAFSARHRMGLAAALPALAAVARIAAAAAFWWTSTDRSLVHYAWFHAAALSLCAAGSWLWVRHALRPSDCPPKAARHAWRDGLGFSAIWAASTALASLDKTVVLRWAGGEIAGLYAITYRFATVLALPVEAMTMAAGPRLFRHGGGVHREPRLVPMLLGAALVLGTLAAVAAGWLAGLLPWLLGPRFAPAVPAAAWMGWFVLFYGLRLLGSNVLMASEWKRLRVAIEVAGLGLLVLLGSAWLPRDGLGGAVAMITCTEGVLAVLIWSALTLAAFRSRASRPLSAGETAPGSDRPPGPR